MSANLDIHPSTRELYRDYSMLRERMHGASLSALALKYGLSKRVVSRRVKHAFYEIQITVMQDVQADPDSPRKAEFTLDEFNRDPQALRLKVLDSTLAKLRKAYPALEPEPHPNAFNPKNPLGLG